MSISISHAYPTGKNGGQAWVATWITANFDLANADVAAILDADPDLTEFNNQTMRSVVRTTVGGRAIRIRLANTFGTRADPL